MPPPKQWSRWFYIKPDAQTSQSLGNGQAQPNACQHYEALCGMTTAACRRLQSQAPSGQDSTSLPKA